MLNKYEWCNILSSIALVIISSLPSICGHLSNVILLVKTVDFFVYLKSINWKNSLASSGLISLKPTSSITKTFLHAYQRFLPDKRFLM